MLEVALLAVVGYLGVLGALYAMQAEMIFPRGATPPPQRALPAGAERWTLTSADGHALHGVHLPGSGADPLVLGFSGNAWNAQDFAVFLHESLPGADVVAFHYRGYPPSDGAPSERALAADALAIFDALAARFSDRPPVVLGVSLGAGVAAHVAAARAPAGAVLVTPFDSIRAVAAERYWWAPVRLLLKHPFDARALLAARPIPTAVVRAEHDRLIRPERTAALTDQLDRLVQETVIADADHTSIIDHPNFPAALRAAVAAVERPQ